MKKFLKILGRVLLYLFAIIGLVFTAVFIGMRFQLFNVRGSIATRNQFFTGASAPLPTNPCTDTQLTCDWNATPEWAVIKAGLIKDAPILLQASKETGVSARMIAAVVIPEQTRFFTANREIFKSYFEPLKILGSLTKFSLGVSGIKEETALAIEKNLADPTSEFYPGPGLDALIAYPADTNHDTELFNRLTDEKNHYYQYLYTALYIKEIGTQWYKHGYDASKIPEVQVTLFNLGFQASKPKFAPQAAGAPITTGGKIYSYGELGSDFYHSGELTDIFPE